MFKILWPISQSQPNIWKGPGQIWSLEQKLLVILLQLAPVILCIPFSYNNFHQKKCLESLVMIGPRCVIHWHVVVAWNLRQNHITAIMSSLSPCLAKQLFPIKRKNERPFLVHVEKSRLGIEVIFLHRHLGGMTTSSLNSFDKIVLFPNQTSCWPSNKKGGGLGKVVSSINLLILDQPSVSDVWNVFFYS